ncbi:MAG: SEL1-like repeat protein [Ruminococcus sp.]|nr:SEL1-like repeat protein [Ruminococcus sp.]
MSLLIVTSRYLKSGTKAAQTKRRNYTKYIATREGVEKRNFENKNDPPTDNQKKLLNDLLQDFPEAKTYLEYEDYILSPTVENTSELVSAIIERNADVIGNRQNFVGYMAMRPGAQKRGAHGLFNDKDEPIVLNQVANEVANHPGNIWSHVVSLRREDAVSLGFDNSDRWRELVKNHIDVIAESTNIKLSNLKWYAAFHDTAHHPHIHLIVYSTNPKEGYLTNKGIEKIRSAFANDIFKDDLGSINQEQTLTRDQLKVLTENEMSSIIKDIGSGEYTNPTLMSLISKLRQQLDESSGKKVYGYLKQPVKQTVDEIFSELAKNEHIQKMYEKWCDFERERYKLYTQKEKDFPPISENKTFQSVKNMIIRHVLAMGTVADNVIELSQPEPPDDDSGDDFSSEIILEPAPIPDEFMDSGEVIETADLHYYFKWTKEYKEACELMYDKNSGQEKLLKAEKLLLSEAEKGNVLALYDLGKLYATDKLGEKDDAKSEQYYAEALKGFMKIEPYSHCLYPFEPKHSWQRAKPKDMSAYVWYRIGKMHCYGLGTENNETEAFKWFKKAATAGNKYAQFSLANMYYYGSGVKQNYNMAFSWYKASANQGQPYAQYAVAQMYANGESVAKDDAEAKNYYAQALAGFLKLEADGQTDDNLFYKLGRMYMNGLGADKGTAKALDYFKRSAELNNKNALFEYGKALLLGENINQDIPQGLDMIKKAVALENANAKRFLALDYILGDHMDQDIDRGIEMLTELADNGDILSAYKLGIIYLKGNLVFENLFLAEKYLREAADDNNEFAMYALAKLYLSDEKRDLSKSVVLLETVCDNEILKPFAAYTYAKLLLDDNEFHDTEKAVKLLEETADDNSWCSYLLGKLYLYGNSDTERSKEDAVKWLTKSVECGNEYAETLLQHSEDYENAMLTNSIFGLFVSLSRMIENEYSMSQDKVQSKVDRKLRRMISQKKEELGIKFDDSMQYS